MADITSYYTVKQDQRGELKLILARDPRVSVAKLPSKSGGGSQPQVVVPSTKSTSGVISQAVLHTDGTVHTAAVKPPVVAAGNTSQKKQQAHLPISRVRTIMKTNVKSSQNTLQFGQDSVMTITKATELSGELGMRLRVNTQSFSTLKELFIAELAKAACTVAAEGSSKEVSYNHLAIAVRKNPEQMRFLCDILPEKVLAKDYLASLNRTESDEDSP